MPKSVSIPAVIALIGTAIFAWLKRGESLDYANYIAPLVAIFNIAAMTALFVVLYLHEKSDDAHFGQAVRVNISTLVASLLINLVGSIFLAVKLFT